MSAFFVGVFAKMRIKQNKTAQKVGLLLINLSQGVESGFSLKSLLIILLLFLRYSKVQNRSACVSVCMYVAVALLQASRAHCKGLCCLATIPSFPQHLPLS